jgi:hypothetical protein
MRMLVRLLALAALAAFISVPAAGSGTVPAPTGVHPFYLRVDDPLPASFPRTPSFAWDPYEGAIAYDFQLATSTKFDDRTLAWSSGSQPVRVPAVSIPIALPWMTGHPHALYVRVRARLAKGATPWSAPFGFDTAGEAPAKLADMPGLVRWTPVDGATSYEVWFDNVVVNGLRGKVITTTTNVADEREYYTGHQDPSWTGTVIWRVRAVRKVYGDLPNALPAVSYGPWSTLFVSVNPPVSSGTWLTPQQTVSDAVTTNGAADAHQLTPGFSFVGDTARNGLTGHLYRVYVATDRQCVNVVFTGSIVGGPAYAPRTSGPVELPPSELDWATYPADKDQGSTFNAESLPVVSNESSASATSGGSTTPPPAAATTTGTATPVPAEFTSTGPFVDLWDLGRTNARYWWTVVPVNVRASGKYQDAESPQDACAAGDVMEFVRTSQPTTTSLVSPFASGLSRFGELVGARTLSPSFYRATLIAWQPAKSATGYEVQWSKTLSPWRARAAVFTASTSMLLDQLTPGVWYYRVRGIDPYVPGPVTQMAWSRPVKVTIAKPKFLVQSGVTTRRLKK